jgi:antitoxin PrlF
VFSFATGQTPTLPNMRGRDNLIDRDDGRYYFFTKCNTEAAAVITTVTSKGQVTIPKTVREAAGIKPGDKVVVRATASGGVYVGHPDKAFEYEERLRALAKRRIIRGGMTTDEFMEFSRGETGAFRRRKK